MSFKCLNKAVANLVFTWFNLHFSWTWMEPILLDRSMTRSETLLASDYRRYLRELRDFAACLVSHLVWIDMLDCWFGELVLTVQPQVLETLARLEQGATSAATKTCTIPRQLRIYCLSAALSVCAAIIRQGGLWVCVFTWHLKFRVHSSSSCWVQTCSLSYFNQKW